MDSQSPRVVSEFSPLNAYIPHTLTEHCRLLAFTLVNLDASPASEDLCAMLLAELNALDAALDRPFDPPVSPYPFDARLYDDRPLTASELAEQCRALALAMLQVSEPWVRASLGFVLWERISALRLVL
ncbi:hypothetical protein JK232_04575 [Nissabacter archeti]|uniref:Uncharacterized protein n=1 Tax=Nissabacter archeti TaxID=1917880 RepID=A0ABS5JFY9_9GAMM|nr:hypothetical protein [Nissabacter archeti]MBS0968163.1 hypothetical protein [Nissabacter archeti]